MSLSKSQALTAALRGRLDPAEHSVEVVDTGGGIHQIQVTRSTGAHPAAHITDLHVTGDLDQPGWLISGSYQHQGQPEMDHPALYDRHRTEDAHVAPVLTAVEETLRTAQEVADGER